MIKHTLLVLARETDLDEFEHILHSLSLPDLEIVIGRNESVIKEHIATSTILLANPVIAKTYINEAHKLKWMQSVFAGVDAMISPDLKQDYILTNVRDTYGEVMAEYVFGYILMFHRKIVEHIDWQRQRNWNQMAYGSLSKKVMCVLGTGSIGMEIAKIGKAFNMTIYGLNSTGARPPNFDETFTLDAAAEYLGNSDYVVNVLPSTQGTRGMINKDFLAFFKKKSVFINVGRGDALIEDDLIQALDSTTIGAAVLDVFHKEPLSESSRLWSVPNLYITPHDSGYTVSKNIFDIFKENYLRFIKGSPLLYEIDFNKGY
jgi:phosphoglycerate dehydrogenase-like enzyme